MTRADKEPEYRYRGQPPTPAVIEDLVGELFAGKLMERKVLAEEILRVHRSRGGADARANFENSFRRALNDMRVRGLAENPSVGYWRIQPSETNEGTVQSPIVEVATIADSDAVTNAEIAVEADAEALLGKGPSAIYLYYLPTYRLRAEERGENSWPCKIGRTDRDPLMRVLSQAGTALPERPHLAIVVRTSNSIAWESALHGVLALRGLRIDNLPGSEWFLTSPLEVLDLIRFFDPNLAMENEQLASKVPMKTGKE